MTKHTFGLFFDKDNTIEDSEPNHWAATRNALTPYGITLTWNQWVTEAVGHPDDWIIRHFIAQTPYNDARHITKAIASKDLNYLRIAQQQSMVPSTVVQLLKNIKEYKIALVTSSKRADAEIALRGADITNCFDTMVCKEDVTHRKPHPEPYLLAKKILNVTRGVAFEDSDSGCASAAAAGLDVVRVASPAELADAVRTYMNTMKTRGYS